MSVSRINFDLYPLSEKTEREKVLTYKIEDHSIIDLQFFDIIQISQFEGVCVMFQIKG